MKSQPTEWENTCKSYILRIRNKLLQLNNNKKLDLKILEMTFLQRYVHGQQAHKQMHTTTNH